MLAVPLSAWPAPERGRVVVAREPDRAKAVAACLDALEFRACEGRDVALKANFNSDDAFPASTHPERSARAAPAPSRWPSARAWATRAPCWNGRGRPRSSGAPAG